ncbi:MAG: hypothetical protein EOP06_26755 [Proteobacteria bacterium]|nr:MAG: hypothetical protein EOP06_26755 [Pseudomonadota bacterium]
MRIFIFLFCLLSGALSLNAQTFTNYKQADGLGADGINAIAIDLLGNKWFGTTNGVTKYDGTTWKTYTTKDGLTDNLIYALASDKHGAIWIGTHTGASMFDGEKWTTYGHKEGINYIRSLAIDDEDNKWFGTMYGVFKFDGTNWTKYTTEDGLIHNCVIGMAFDFGGEVVPDGFGGDALVRACAGLQLVGAKEECRTGSRQKAPCDSFEQFDGGRMKWGE